MTESVRCILPRHLLSFLTPLLNDIVAHLQMMCDREESGNSPLKQALALLMRGQQSLDDRILHEMSTEDQLSYAYMVYCLNESMARYQDSPEELLSSHELATLVALLLSLCHSPQERDSEQAVSQDVFNLIVSACGSVINEHRMLFVQNPTVMEALYAHSKGSLEYILVACFLYTGTSLTKLLFKYDAGIEFFQQSQTSGTQDLQELLLRMKYMKGFGIQMALRQALAFLSKEFKEIAVEGRDGYKRLDAESELLDSLQDSSAHTTIWDTPVSLEKNEESFDKKQYFKKNKIVQEQNGVSTLSNDYTIYPDVLYGVVDNFGNTPLHKAILSGDAEIIEALSLCLNSCSVQHKYHAIQDMLEKVQQGELDILSDGSVCPEMLTKSPFEKAEYAGPRDRSFHLPNVNSYGERESGVDLLEVGPDMSRNKQEGVMGQPPTAPVTTPVLQLPIKRGKYATSHSPGSKFGDDSVSCTTSTSPSEEGPVQLYPTFLSSSTSSLDSDYSSSSDLIPTPPDKAITQPLALVSPQNYSSTEESEITFRASVLYYDQYAHRDSVTSLSDSTCPVKKKRPKSATCNKQRKQTEARILRYRLPTSESDNSVYGKRVYCRRKQNSRKHVHAVLDGQSCSNLDSSCSSSQLHEFSCVSSESESCEVTDLTTLPNERIEKREWVCPIGRPIHDNGKCSNLDSDCASECEKESSCVPSDSEPYRVTIIVPCTVSDQVGSKHMSNNVHVQQYSAHSGANLDATLQYSNGMFLRFMFPKPIKSNHMIPLLNMDIVVNHRLCVDLLLHLSPYFPTYSYSSPHDTRILKSAYLPTCMSVLPPCVKQPCDVPVYHHCVKQPCNVPVLRHCVKQPCNVTIFPPCIEQLQDHQLCMTILPHQPCKIAVQRETSQTISVGWCQGAMSAVVVHRSRPVFCKYPEIKCFFSHCSITVPIPSKSYTDLMLFFLSPYLPTYSCSSLHNTRLFRPVTRLPVPDKHTPDKFDKDAFKSWILVLLQGAGYNCLRDITHQQWHVIFGFVSVRGVTLTNHQRRRAKVVLDVADSFHKVLSKDILENLSDLCNLVYGGSSMYVCGDIVSCDLRRGHKPKSAKKDTPRSKGADVKPLNGAQGSDSDYCTGSPTSGEEGKVKPRPSERVSSHGAGVVHKCNDKQSLSIVPEVISGDEDIEYVEARTVLCNEAGFSRGKPLSRPSSRIEEPSRQKSRVTDTPVQEVSSDVSVLGFANPNNPLDVIQSHMTSYSKCCPRHDIENILTCGITVPASDAFGPKRIYPPIKDIKDDPRHGKFNSIKSLTKESNKEYVYRESHQVMSDRPMPESVRRNKAAMPQLASDTTQPLSPSVSQLQSLHPILPRSRQQDITVELPTQKQGLQSIASEGYSKLHGAGNQNKTTDDNDNSHRKASGEARHDHSRNNNTSPSPTAQRSVVAPRHTDSLNPLLVPDDHKERLRSTAELLHAQDYARILPLSYDGQPPEYFPPEIKIPYVFITGLAYYKMSSHKKSVQYFHQCLGLAEQCERDGDVTICNIYIGDIDFAQRKYTEAAGRYQTALHFYSRDSVAKDFRMILPTKSAVWSKCGAAFKNASRMGDAVSAYEQAIGIASSRKDRLSAHTSLGNLFQGIGENDRAVKEYEEAIELAKELDDDVSLGWNHGNLGNALLGLHQRDKALHHLFKALDMAVDYETTPTAIGRAYNNLGTAFQSLSELVKAEEYYDLALAQAIYGNDISGQARVYGNIGNLQMLNKQYDRAVPHYTEVMRLSNDKATITTAHHNRGCAYYDWAEKKKKNAIVRASNKASTGFKVSLHGRDFERCEETYRPLIIHESVQKYYLQGTRDLDYVIKHHEVTFSGIKGSPKGLSLSVSLFETNSRTFHRMQDCLVHLQKSEDESKYEEALLVAEQSRARTLGELLLKRRNPQLRHELVSPSTSTQQLKEIVKRQNCPVLYLSYTGERLLGWLLYPSSGRCSINMFEVPLGENEFDGKSFDYHLRYSLNEQLVEKSFEMYKPFDRKKDKTEPVEKLYDLVARPVMTMLETLDKHHSKDEQQHNESSKNNVRKIIIVPDSYTNLLPFTCVLNRETGRFWGDECYFQIMPSLLTMGILDQLPAVSVSIPVQHQQMLCVVGNPTIPPFKYNNDQWDLGKLPHATKEAEWVSHILKCNPILHEQATKDAVMMRVMNAKVIHLATHGSAVAGFLAFAGMTASSTDAVDAKKVLIYPEEIESLNISPALVVLSSCDSGRGVFKADGIQGMARAFILAGAQAVLTTLWRVPDESACIFMQFFYQYLVDGVCGTEALHKAILCLRCFSKYSQYIHWSGYQLTGREFQFAVNQSSSRSELTTRLGHSSVFPRLDILKELEGALVNNPRLPTDVQVCV